MSIKLYRLFVVTSLVLIGLVFFGIYDLVYSSTVEREEQRIQQYIYNIAEYSGQVMSIHPEILITIIDEIKPNMSEEEKMLVESSTEYLHTREHLQIIKKYFSDYVSYIYIITPKEDGVYFVVAGHDTFTEIDQYGSKFDITPFEYLQVAFNEQRPLVEPRAGYDPDYNLYSISAYSPLFFNGKFYGLLGVDLELKGYNKLRYAYSFIAIIISVFGLTCMVMTTLYISEKVSIMKPVSKGKKSR